MLHKLDNSSSLLACSCDYDNSCMVYDVVESSRLVCLGQWWTVSMNQCLFVQMLLNVCLTPVLYYLLG